MGKSNTRDILNVLATPRGCVDSATVCWCSKPAGHNVIRHVVIITADVIKLVWYTSDTSV